MSTPIRTITRRIDDLGRISLPADFRTALGITTDTSVNLLLEGQSIVLSVGEKRCVICGKAENVNLVCNHHLCNQCITNIKNIV